MQIHKTDLALMLGFIAVLQGLGLGALAIAFITVFILGRLTAERGRR